MHSRKRLKNIRELELFLFGGVPETAEQMYERDSYGHFEIRTTRRPVLSYKADNESFPDPEQGFYEIDEASGELKTYDSGGNLDYPLSVATEKRES